jgi:hypothetical protein
MSSVIISKVDVNNLQSSPTGSVSLAMNNDEILYKIDENSVLTPIINIGPTGPGGLTGPDGNAGATGISAYGVNGYNLEGTWHKPTCFYGDPIFGTTPYYTVPQAISNKSYRYLTWMYEYIVTKKEDVDAIGTYFGSNSGGGTYRLFIYDSGTNSAGYSYPVNLLYQSGQLTYATQGFRSMSLGGNLTFTPGVYWIGIVCSGALSRFNVVSSINIKSILGNIIKADQMGPSITGLLENTTTYSWCVSGMPNPMSPGIMTPSTGLQFGPVGGVPTYMSPYPIYLRKAS